MFWISAILLGIIIGLVTGFIAERLPVPQELQSVGAAYAAMPFGAIAVAVLWFLRPVGGLGAISLGITVNALVWLVGLGLIAAVLHVAIGRVGASFPALVRHRPLVLGVLGGLYGALPVAWLMVESTQV